MIVELLILKERFLSFSFLFFMLFACGFNINYEIVDGGIGKKTFNELPPFWKRFCDTFILAGSAIMLFGAWIVPVVFVSAASIRSHNIIFYIFWYFLMLLLWGLCYFIISKTGTYFSKRLIRNDNQSTIADYLKKSTLIYTVFVIAFILLLYYQYFQKLSFA